MLFPSLLPLAAVSWMSVASPAETAKAPASVVEAAQLALTASERKAASDMVEVVLYDENHPETLTIRIGRDGTVDDATRKELQRLFRCKRTGRQRPADKGMLAMLADVASQYPGQTIELVSGFRATDRHTSRHWQGRAIDFRIKGARMTEVRDYIWATHTSVGLGWYPENGFVHMDHREDGGDIAWTETGGVNHYHPSWSQRVRRGEALKQREQRVGL